MTFHAQYVAEISKCGSINKAAHQAFSLPIRYFYRREGALRRSLAFSFSFAATAGGIHAEGQGVSQLRTVRFWTKKSELRALGEAATHPPRRIPLSPPSAIPLRRRLSPYLQSTEDNRYLFSIKRTGHGRGVMMCRPPGGHRCDLPHGADRKNIPPPDWTHGTWISTKLPPCPPAFTCGQVIALGAGRGDRGRFWGSPTSPEHDQGVASDFSEETDYVPLKKTRQMISVNKRATVMHVLPGQTPYHRQRSIGAGSHRPGSGHGSSGGPKTCIRLGGSRPATPKSAPKGSSSFPCSSNRGGLHPLHGGIHRSLGRSNKRFCKKRVPGVSRYSFMH